MRKIGLYFRLAWTNIKANYRLYVPYLIASTGMIMMYYIISMLAMDPSLKMGYLSPTLGSGSFVVALFAISFILYINSFLMKRRTKEFGLYNILGMEKPQIALIVFIETLLSFLIASVSGILIGTIFAKLVQLFLLRLIRYGGDIVMQINPEAVLNTVLIFGVIYAVAYLSTLRTIHKTKPADMLSSSNAGEQEPRAKWILSVIGAAALLGGYWLSQYVQSPMEAFIYFFIAIALVMVGTYLLFTTGSIAILKMLQKNKKFYYQKNHFINVSGMMYRMKQNARGLAQICILSCMVLVTISMTVSLYFGVEDMLRNRYGREVKVASYVNSLSQRDEVRSEVLTKAGNPIQNELYYVSSESKLMNDRGHYTYQTDAIGMDDFNTVLYIYSIDDYNRILGENVSLGNNEILLYSSASYDMNELTVDGHSYSIQQILSRKPKELASNQYSAESVQVIYVYCNDPYAMTAEVQNSSTSYLSFVESFDNEMSDEQQSAFCDELNTSLFSGDQLDGHAGCIDDDRNQYYWEAGSYLFVGVFLGGIFLIATVLIIYYKQVSEGYEDRHRYQILQQVGLSRQEVRKTINSQVLTVFFLPLAAALLHIFFAFHMVYELMLAFNLDNVQLFFRCMLCTAAVFALIYGLVYVFTSRVYYHIVEQPSEL